MDNKLRLSTPWVTLYREYEAMFGDDPDIDIDYVAGDGEDPVIKLRVRGQDKADAIERLLPDKYEFGGVTVNIIVIPDNKDISIESLFRAAFEGNPAFSYAATAEGIFTNPLTYIVFRNRVVQFWNDDLGDINGNESTLYENIAHEIFDDVDNVCFCTDTPSNLGKPANE